MSLLRAEGLSRSFGSLRAVNDVSMAIAPGELRALIGANGAGKTTFFNLLSGFLPPSSGRIVFDGQDITSLAAEQRVGLGIARTFQITEVFPELPVRENLRIPVEVAARPRRWRRRSTNCSSWASSPGSPSGWPASCRTATSAPPRS
jgi:branched-chain amino acid transport system ATP-binding protein